ncbi:syndecan 4-B-like [Pelobates fuscus]|uniref:syndecan 4-B-like n=1 Tax=Pelobates fuscus TaxID=191477 RepID=UPI002FE468FE
MNPTLFVLVFLVSAAAAESIRETETMDRRGFYEDIEASGNYDDDEDIDESTYTTDSKDSDYDSYESSGSGDSDEEESTVDITTTLGNRIPEDDIMPKDKNDYDVSDTNDIIIPRKTSDQGNLEPSNEISMASTGNGGFFNRKEVVVALVAGTLVGLVFAVLIIVVLVMRLQKKDVNGCDSVKKPIYKKAPTIEA